MSFSLDPEFAAALAPILTRERGGPNIEVGQLDAFRDEDTAYATTLSRAGVEVEFHLRPGVPHEFDAIAPDSDVAHRAVADRVRVLKSL
ncbi:alpha/beta hydrolase fold domain-containing protein [Promicromonospora sp. NPDC023987]|uniref:alpha/beta hydrolase n=1 Tax=Promicromonospora sp. NPDC023987 TaxID=3155360 RepID=UPI0033E537CB